MSNWSRRFQAWNQERKEAENENARISNVNYIFLVDDDNDRRLLIPFDVHFNIVLSWEKYKWERHWNIDQWQTLMNAM